MTRLPASLLSDPALVKALDAIEAGGRRAYLVGGAVRNALIGRRIDDIDIATDAPPDEVTRLARRAGLKAVPTGIEHGTVTIVSQGRGFEVTTFRRDVETDGRRAVVAFSENLSEDALRRDFTMNALYADRAGLVIDPVGGLADLAARRVRFVGRPTDRIREDYLRILRFFRFLALYGQQADPEAIAAIETLGAGLASIARERIGAEMMKLLAADDPAPAIQLMARTGVLGAILPGASAEDLARLIPVETAEGVGPDAARRLAALGGAGDLAERLRLSRAEGRQQDRLRAALASGWSPDEAGYRMGARAATDLLLLRAARGGDLPPGWRARLDRAEAATLPIAARDLADRLQGRELGRGLAAAEAAWIASGFTLAAPDLIDAALLAAKEDQ